MATFTFTYEIHYKGSVDIDGGDQAAATATFQQLQIDNLLTIAGAPQKAVVNVASDTASTQNNGPTWEEY